MPAVLLHASGDQPDLAHPLLGGATLELSGLAVFLTAAAVVLAAATLPRSSRPPAPPVEPAPAAAPVEAQQGRSVGPLGWAGRALLLTLLALLIVAARTGPPVEPFNLASLSVVYLLWPLGLLGAALLGRPRAPVPVDAPAAPPVWPAVVPAALWVAFLSWYGVLVPPRAVGNALLAYGLVVLTGCIALGGGAWRARAEPFSLLWWWAALLRRGALVHWRPPRGAAVLLGSLLGGLAFSRYRLTGPWGRYAVSPRAEVWLLAWLAGALALGALVGFLCARRARAEAAISTAVAGADGSVAAALVPAVIGTAVAVLARRTMVALQLLPRALDDPFGRGWHLAFWQPDAVDANPWGTVTQQLLAAGLVLAGHVVGAWVLARRVPRGPARQPAGIALAVSAGASALAVLSV